MVGLAFRWHPSRRDHRRYCGDGDRCIRGFPHEWRWSEEDTSRSSGLRSGPRGPSGRRYRAEIVVPAPDGFVRSATRPFYRPQVRAVSGASFQRKKILNVGEYRVFRIIEAELISIRRGFRAFAQTSLGEILNSLNQDAFSAINAKRVDILVVDQGGWPVLAIEYQGAGHYQGTAVARDTIKVTALNNAGVGYLEIFESDGVDQIRTRLREHLARTWDSRNPTASKTTV